MGWREIKVATSPVCATLCLEHSPALALPPLSYIRPYLNSPTSGSDNTHSGSPIEGQHRCPTPVVCCAVLLQQHAHVSNFVVISWPCVHRCMQPCLTTVSVTIPCCATQRVVTPYHAMHRTLPTELMSTTTPYPTTPHNNKPPNQPCTDVLNASFVCWQLCTHHYSHKPHGWKGSFAD